MTKERPPVSVELALTKVAALITWETAATLVEREVRCLRNWSDPDTPAEISLKDSIKLDAAYLAAGGGAAPFLGTYELLLGTAAKAAAADSARLAASAAAAAKEGGEAVSSLIMASRPGASRTERLVAKRDVEEAMAALAKTLPDLDASGPEVPPPRPSEAPT